MIGSYPQRQGLGASSRPKSSQTLVNEAVADLHVVCLGVDGNALVFKRTAKATGSPEDLLAKIAKKLLDSEPIRIAMANRITSFTLI